MPDQIDWLNTDLAAKSLGITPRTLYRFIDDGQLPAYRFGRVIRLKRTDVDEFIEACRIDPGSLGTGQPDTGQSDAPQPDADRPNDTGTKIAS